MQFKPKIKLNAKTHEPFSRWLLNNIKQTACKSDKAKAFKFGNSHSNKNKWLCTCVIERAVAVQWTNVCQHSTIA